MAALDKFKRKSVIVYIPTNAKDRYHYLSPVVYKALQSDARGKTYPYAVASSPNQREIFGIYNNALLKDESQLRKTAQGFKEKMESHDATALPKGEIYLPLKSKESFYKGTFKGVSDKGIILTIQGKDRTYPLTDLTQGCTDFAKSLGTSTTTSEENTTASEDTKEYPMEDWQSAKGDKTIQGKFVSLTGNQLTLEKPDGKTISFDIKFLSEESQTRANELGKN